ncbi:MAG TPA: hypothetical protein VFB52_12770 [Solirubrobacterales bacterium]|nr:hypothetical protein [Solirubrobacterales bacterium]
MKRALLITIAALVACSATVAHGAERSFNVLLTGGDEVNSISVKLSTDGRSYLIDSAFGPLEAPSGICEHREGSENSLICEATAIASFEVNAGGGNDHINFSPKVPVPVTLRGGPGDDRLKGGSASDKLVGGAGNDKLYGRAGDDWLFGGPGNDVLYGSFGDDRLLGGPGVNEIFGGSGTNETN